MESRRGPRYVIDPKFRQVGFVTPGSETQNPNSTSALPAVVGNSPSPVIIPPPRLPDIPSKASPLPVPSPPPRKQPSIEVPLPGSYIPSESVLGNSPVPSPCSRNDSNGRYTGVPSESLDMSPSYVSKANSELEGLSLKDEFSDRFASRTAAAPAGDLPANKQQPTVSASAGSASSGSQALPPAEAQPSTKSLKGRTSKAERRAKQEADREAKRAARESGKIGSYLYPLSRYRRGLVASRLLKEHRLH